MGIFGFPLQRAFNGDCRRDYARLRASPGAAEIYGKVATFVFYAVMVLVIAFGPEIGAARLVYLADARNGRVGHSIRRADRCRAVKLCTGDLPPV